MYLQILVDNVQILFKDDCVDTYDEYATPSPLIFKRLQLLRENNTINIQPYDVVSVSNTAEDVSADRIKSMTAEIELLRKKLTAMNYLKEENLALRQYEEETKLLRYVTLVYKFTLNYNSVANKLIIEFVPILTLVCS